jgi:transposase
LPPEKPRTGRPNEDHRRILNGILWVLRTGAPWRDLPRRYGPVGTVSSRFYRWRASGVWERILTALQAEADARGEVDWDLHFVDASIIRAHQHAAGARRNGAIGRGVRPRPGRRWAAAKAGSRPSCTCAPRATASRSRRR